MAHKEQKDFFDKVKQLYPKKFRNVVAVDCGSLNVNGTLRDMFTDSQYTGVDIVAGPNVDIVMPVYQLSLVEDVDTVVSGEMLEHSEYYKEDLRTMYAMLRSGGLLAISAAGEGREEHGTLKTGALWGTSSDYYRNIVEDDFRSIFNLNEEFIYWRIEENSISKDIYFYGIKK